MHVLIIEDEPLIGLNLQFLLQEAGADSVDLADTEDDAVRAALDHPPDLITSDLTLREGDGRSAVRKIQAAIGAVPIIFITATPSACGAVAGECRVFGKPIDEAAITQAVRQLGKRQ